MSVSITAQTQISANTWALSWSSDLADPVFFVYQNGVLKQATRATSGQFRVTSNDQLLVEILDDPSQSPTFVYPGVSILSWYQTPATTSYKIEQWNGSSWIQIDSVPDLGNWVLQWTSPFLPDCQAFQFRVTPIGKNGNPGTPQIFSGFMVRIPDAPTPIFTLNTDNTVTIS